MRADDALEARGLGRAHHRVLYFLARRPGRPVGALLDVLGVSKQSLGRITNDQRRPGQRDRRQRLLYLTREGAKLEHDLFDELHRNMARAYEEAGEEAVRGYWIMMQHLMDAAAHGRFLDFADAGTPAP